MNYQPWIPDEKEQEKKRDETRNLIFMKEEACSVLIGKF